MINKAIEEWLKAGGNTLETLADALGLDAVTLGGRLNGDSEWLWSEAVAVSGLTGYTLNRLAGIE